MKATTPTTGMSFLFLIIYLTGLSAFGSFVNDMYVPSLPSMTRFFHCSVPMAQLGLTFGMIGLGAGQMVMGPFSYKYGRKPVLLCSILVFVAAAVVSVFSPTIHFFLFCRLFQGLGASGGYFLARTIPTDVYEGRQLAKFMAVIGAVNGFAPASAPVIGGMVSGHFGWQAVFMVLSAFALLLLCLYPKLKETWPASKRPAGSVWLSFRNYVTLVKNRPFMIHALFKGGALGFLFAYISSSPFIMQNHFGWSQTDFGFFMGFNAIFVAVGSMVALKFKTLKRSGYIGSLILVAFVIPEAIVLWMIDNFWVYEVLLWPILFSLGMIFTDTNTLAMNEGRAMAGGASAILGVIGYIYGAIVAPLAGLGEVVRSTAIVFVVMAAVIMVFSLLSKRIPADLNSRTGS